MGTEINTDTAESVRSRLTGDLFGGFAAMLVALPSAIAYGLIIFAPLGQEYAGNGAVAGIIGAVVLGIAAPIFGGTPRLVSSPCAPAAAVLSVFAAEIAASGSFPRGMIPLFIALVACGAGLVQLIAGLARGGIIIKYIPYPVVAGYLSGVGILIFLGQLPKFIGLPKGAPLAAGIISPGLWRWESVLVGAATIMVMLITPKIVKALPASIAALAAGIGCYFGISLFNPSLLSFENNPFVIGHINVSPADIGSAVSGNFSSALSLDPAVLMNLAVPVLTLGVLLSIDTLKTCVVLDVLTGTRHNSNRELFGQGISNMAAAFAGGIPGSGTMGGTLVNIYSGGRTKASGMIEGLCAFAVLLLFARFIAWIPLASLAGVLLVVAVRMVDRKSLQLLRHRSTVFDFIVILAVVVSAVSMSLIIAAGVGILLAIVLFLREQLRFPVVRRKVHGSQIFSKRNRLASEHAILEEKGRETLVIELQGQLFFGTTDQLYTEIEPFIGECRYFILNMRRVLSVDFTAANMMTQIKAKINQSGGHLIFSSVPLSVPTGQNVRQYLVTLGFTSTGAHDLFFPELDSALEWVENEYLREQSAKALQDRALELSEFEFFAGVSDKALSTLALNIEQKAFQNGMKISSQGDPGGEIYFIKKGEVRIEMKLSNGATHHLASFGRGDFFGDMSFLDREPRSADAIAVGDVGLFVMTRGHFDLITEKYPDVAGIFYYRLAYEISRRFRLNLIELKAFEEN